MRKLLICCCILALSSLTFAQAYVADEGSTLLSLTGSLSRTKGDIFETNTTTRLESDIAFFGVRNVAVGGVLLYERSTGEESNSTQFDIGPAMGYYFGDRFASMIPFVSAALVFDTVKLDDHPEVNRSRAIASCGLIVATTEHAGFVLKLSYRNILEESKRGTLALGLGLTGFLY